MTRHSVKLLRASPEIKSFIKGFEELRLKAYQDAAGIPTIGWGHTSNVKMGSIITRTQAEDYFRADLGVVEGTIRLAVKVPLSQGEYDALCSFIFNIGGGAFSKSTMRTMINELRYEDAGPQLLRWVYAGGKKLAGLQRRREGELRFWNMKD